MDGGWRLYSLGDLITVFAGGLGVTLSLSIMSPRNNGGISMMSSGRRRACSRSTRSDRSRLPCVLGPAWTKPPGMPW